MSMPKMNLLLAMVTAIALAFAVFAGCGSSQEHKMMSDFLQKYHKTVDEYAEAVNSSDENRKVALDNEVHSLMTDWTAKKMKTADTLTPQVLNQLDEEYRSITAKYNQLKQKS